MEERKSLIMDASNGYRYQFVEFLGHIITYAWWDEKWNHIGRDFKNFDEAITWVKHFDEPVESASTMDFPIEIPDDYYGVRGRYYGD